MSYNPADVPSVASVAQLRLNNTGAQNGVIWLASYSGGASPDGGEGAFMWNATSTAADDGGKTIAVTGVTTGRWIRETQGLPYSVKWFGADSTGAMPADAAIQATVNAAQLGNGQVYFPGGIYSLSAAISLTAATQISGAGVGSTFIRPAVGIAAFSASTANAITIRDLYIQYTSPQSGGTAAILVTAPSGTNTLSSIRGVQISGCLNGIVFSQSAFWTVDRCFIENFTGHGVQLSNALDIDVGDSSVTNCTFFSFGAGTPVSGINWLSSGGLRVSNNKFGSLPFGVLFQYAGNSGSSAPNTAQLIVEGNSFDTMSTAAIQLARSTTTDVFNSVVITGNMMPSCAVGVSVPLDSVASWLSSVVIANNTWIGPATGSPVGFELNSTSNFIITNNTLVSNLAASGGIALGAQSSGGLVTGNNLAGTFTSQIFNAGTGNRILNNAGVTTDTPVTLSGTLNVTTSAPYGSLFISGVTNVTFPQPFNSTPVVVASCASSTFGDVSAIATNITNTGFQILGIGVTNSVTLTLAWTASGS